VARRAAAETHVSQVILENQDIAMEHAMAAGHVKQQILQKLVSVKVQQRAKRMLAIAKHLIQQSLAIVLVEYAPACLICFG
jgi:hypothetical protein